jgi:hypothetical protein
MSALSMDSIQNVIPSQEDAAACEQSSGDLITELQEMFAPYNAAYDEKVRAVELSRATVYQLAIKLAYEIQDLLTKVKSGSIFAKHVVDSLWDLTTARVYDDDEDDDEEFTPEVNVVSILYDFLTLCGNYPNAPFAATTFGLITHRKQGKYDPNYDTSFKKASITLGESRFVDVFRAFRSIVSRIIKSCTGTYDVPEREFAHEWEFSIRGANSTWKRVKCTKEFEEFIMEMAPVYENLEKFTPELKELFDVFIEASSAAKAHRAARDAKREAREARELRQMREKRDQRRPRQASAPVQATVKPVEQRPFVPAPPVASRWGVKNPVTGAALPVVNALVPTPVLIEEPRELAEVANDGEGEFQVVSRQQKRSERGQNWQPRGNGQRAPRRESAPQREGDAQSGQVAPGVQRRMDRSRVWREKHAQAAQ